MKTMISKNLLEKIKLYDDDNFVNELNHLINLIQSGNKEVFSKSRLVENGIYVFRLKGMRIFYSIQKNEVGDDVLVFLDFTLRKNLSDKLITKNPISNHSINPKYNHSINPVYNHSINPKYNRSINPVYNRSINPKYNRSINPIYNPSFDGYYSYTLDLEATEYIINVNEKIKLFFEDNTDLTKYAVDNGDKGYVIFNSENQWIEYMYSDLKTGFLLFSKKGDWIGTIQ